MQQQSWMPCVQVQVGPCSTSQGLSQVCVQARLCNCKQQALMSFWGQGGATALGQHTKGVNCMMTSIA